MRRFVLTLTSRDSAPTHVPASEAIRPNLVSARHQIRIKRTCSDKELEWEGNKRGRGATNLWLITLINQLLIECGYRRAGVRSGCSCEPG